MNIFYKSVYASDIVPFIVQETFYESACHFLK